MAAGGEREAEEAEEAAEGDALEEASARAQAQARHGGHGGGAHDVMGGAGGKRRQALALEEAPLRGASRRRVALDLTGGDRVGGGVGGVSAGTAGERDRERDRGRDCELGAGVASSSRPGPDSGPGPARDGGSEVLRGEGREGASLAVAAREPANPGDERGQDGQMVAHLAARAVRREAERERQAERERRLDRRGSNGGGWVGGATPTYYLPAPPGARHGDGGGRAGRGAAALFTVQGRNAAHIRAAAKTYAAFLGKRGLRPSHLATGAPPARDAVARRDN